MSYQRSTDDLIGSFRTHLRTRVPWCGLKFKSDVGEAEYDAWLRECTRINVLACRLYNIPPRTLHLSPDDPPRGSVSVLWGSWYDFIGALFHAVKHHLPMGGPWISEFEIMCDIAIEAELFFNPHEGHALKRQYQALGR